MSTCVSRYNDSVDCIVKCVHARYMGAAFTVCLYICPVGGSTSESFAAYVWSVCS